MNGGERILCGERACCGEWACCGERACPALGCEAAPKPANAFWLKDCGARVRAASRPNAGQARSPQQAR
ncbi:hypothetical protein FPT15_04090 [Pseudomonas sp. RGB]|nr:hypothetical protein FPT15_04090 [Pseudomonas sp. RGB]